MRLPYVDNPPTFDAESDNAIVRRVQERRGERGLIPLDLALLHSPPVADGWNSFLKAIRTGTSLPASIRETAICRVAALNRAWFEWDAHAPILKASAPDIFTQPVLDYILSAPPYTAHASEGSKPGELGASDGKRGLDEKHLAVLAYTDAMTKEVEVPGPVFERLRKSFEEREVVEITATVAAYNCVSRFLVALDVGERNGSR